MDSLDRTLYGTSRTPAGGGQLIRVYSDLGGIVRKALGKPARFFRERDDGQRGGVRTAILKKQNNSMFPHIPLARPPIAPGLSVWDATANWRCWGGEPPSPA